MRRPNARASCWIPSWGASRDREISVTRESDAGTDILVVTVRTRLPLVGGLGPRWLTVHGRSLVEGP